MKNVYKLGFYRKAETTPDMFVGTGIYWHNDTEYDASSFKGLYWFPVAAVAEKSAAAVKEVETVEYAVAA